MSFKRISLALVILLMVNVVHAQEDGGGRLTSGDGERSYYIHFSPDYDGTSTAPLVIALHGAGMSGTTLMALSDFNAQADAAGHIIVYPDGLYQAWDWLRREDVPDDMAYVDDLAFITDLIDHLVATYAIDEDRVYVVGYSSGGMMALRLRCEMPERLAGVAVVGANLTFELAEYCMGAGPTSLLMVLGTADSASPWFGSAVPDESGRVDLRFSINQTMMFLPVLGACGSVPPLEEVTAPDSPVRVMRDRYPDCADGTEFTLYSLVDAPHDWPGDARILLDSGQTGGVNDVIWQFFAAHSR